MPHFLRFISGQSGREWVWLDVEAQMLTFKPLGARRSDEAIEQLDVIDYDWLYTCTILLLHSILVLIDTFLLMRCLFEVGEVKE